MILYQLQLFFVIFLKNLEFYIQVIGIEKIWTKKLCKSVLAFVKVHIGVER